MRIMYPYSKNVNKTYPNRLYESQFPGDQDAPLGFWGNDFGGNINRPVLIDYTVVGYTNDRLWLQSKTGDSSDAIIIGFSVDPHNFDRVWAGKKASFAATLEWDNLAQGWYYQWTCTKMSW